MRIVVAVAFALTASLAAARTPPSAPELGRFVEACMRSPDLSDVADPRPLCQCTAELIGPRLTGRQLHILATVMPSQNDEESAAKLERQFAEEGYSEEEIDEVMLNIPTIFADFETRCRPLRS